MSAEIVAHLVDEMEEYYGAFEHFPLYLLSWELRGLVPPEQMPGLAQQAFDVFTARHPSKIVWVRWPLDLSNTRPLERGTPLDFDLDPDSPPDVELQVLVPSKR